MWRVGCVVYSLAVSIKMNVLLFAPGLLLLLVQSQPNWGHTAICLGICAGVQLVLGAPFLTTHPVSYLRKAFELDRVFFYEWTVNWKFVPEQVFVSRPWALLLLGMHLGCLAALGRKWWLASASSGGWRHRHLRLSPTYVVYTLFVSNYVGICFARTLHYQFYSWYFHTVPFLAWTMAVDGGDGSDGNRHTTGMPLAMRIGLVGMIEYAFNVFPATAGSSYVLQSAQFVLLAWLWMAQVPPSVVVVTEEAGGGGHQQAASAKKD